MPTKKPKSALRNRLSAEGLRKAKYLQHDGHPRSLPVPDWAPLQVLELCSRCEKLRVLKLYKNAGVLSDDKTERM